MKAFAEGILVSAIITIVMFALTLVYGVRVEDMKLIQDSLTIMVGMLCVAAPLALYLHTPDRTTI